MNVILFIMVLGLFLEEIARKLRIYVVYNAVYYLGGTAAILIAALCLYQIAKKKQWNLKIWDICFLALLGWGLISSLLADDISLAVQGTNYRKDGYFSYLIYAAMYIGGRLIDRESIRIRLLQAIGITSSLLCLRWVFEGDLCSIFLNTNHFAYFLIIGIMALAGLFVYENNKWLRPFYIALLCLDIYTLIYNDTFGAYIAVMAAFLFLAVTCFIKKRNLLLRAFVCIAVFVGISVGVNAKTGLVSNNFRSLYTDAGKIADNAENAGGAGSGRIGLWKQAFCYIKERPLFGFGPEGLSEKYYEDGFSNDRPHNEYIQCAAFLGIPALFMYLAGLGSIFVWGCRKIKTLNSGILIAAGAVMAYCVSAFFGNTMYYTAPYFFMVLGVAARMQEE